MGHNTFTQYWHHVCESSDKPSKITQNTQKQYRSIGKDAIDRAAPNEFDWCKSEAQGEVKSEDSNLEARKSSRFWRNFFYFDLKKGVYMIFEF